MDAACAAEDEGRYVLTFTDAHCESCHKCVGNTFAFVDTHTGIHLVWGKDLHPKHNDPSQKITDLPAQWTVVGSQKTFQFKCERGIVREMCWGYTLRPERARRLAEMDKDTGVCVNQLVRDGILMAVYRAIWEEDANTFRKIMAEVEKRICASGDADDWL